MTTTDHTTTSPAAPSDAKRRRQTRLGAGNRGIAVGSAILLGIVVLGIVAPSIVGHSGSDLSGTPLSAPSADHPFGTDTLGRDVFVRTFEAARTDYSIALVGVVVAVIIGSVLGTLVTITRHEFWGRALMRITDGLISVPFNLLILLIVIGVGVDKSLPGLPPGSLGVVLAVWAVGWSIYARLARAEAKTIVGTDYITAAKMMGYSRIRIGVRHVLPSVAQTTGTYAVADTIMIIGLLAGLPFLGAGIVPPTPEWGVMMFEGRGVIEYAWWCVTFPAAALVLSAIAISLVADGLIDKTTRRVI
ncbi:ABC transporter permease [Rhodococcus fascians]|nr:ABC transporter permease [Rhodococcus fascians]